MTPPALQSLCNFIQTIKVNLLRRPLWQVATVQDCLDLSRGKINALIESGELAWAFDLGRGKTRSEVRILAACVVERVTGPIKEIGATRNLKLPEVINLVLPKRGIRSPELERIFSCGHQHVYRIAENFTVESKPKAASGPNGFTVYTRVSVAAFLESARMQ